MSALKRRLDSRSSATSSERSLGRRKLLFSRVLVLGALSSGAVGLAVSCQETDTTPKTKPATDAGTFFDVGGDGAHFCGNESHKVLANPPLLYFIMDASGSMSDKVGSKTKYELLRETSVDLVSSLGSNIRVGAAVFPHGATLNDSCATGAEVMAPQVGGGGTTHTFDTAINIAPSGGTPTSATITALTPKFANASKDTAGEAVLLVTDGGPNCDSAVTSCTAAECEPNIENACPVANCCDPAEGGTTGNCLDRAATLQAIGNFVKGGAHVYVIGLAVNSAYEGVLEQMAIVGGAAQTNPPFYYQVNDLSKLEDTFHAIAGTLISCEFTLADPPSTPDLTNVYLDGTVVLQDPMNGWVWDGTNKIKLVGDACNELKSGKVQDVAVISGCPTMTPL